jgi:hypothetical protein
LTPRDSPVALPPGDEPLVQHFIGHGVIDLSLPTEADIQRKRENELLEKIK